MRNYLLALLVAAVVPFLVTPLLRRVAVRFKVMSPIRDRDVHDVPVPRLGGVAILLGVLAGFLIARQLPLLREVYDGSGDIRGVLSGAVLICLLGVIDDRWGLDALTKLAGQVLAAGVMVLQGVQLLWLPLGETFVMPPELGAILTILVVVVTVNAVNFVDGLDGLAAGLVMIGSAAFFSYAYLLTVRLTGVSRAALSTLIAAVLFGACLGFLYHNFHPARIFMGDSGSMLIGLLLAASVITLTGQVEPNSVVGETLPLVLPLLLPFAVLAVPLIDLLLAVVRRTRAGVSPFSPDKQHLHHRLLEIGHSQGRSVIVMYLWSAIIAFDTVAVVFVPAAPLIAGTVVAVIGGALVTVWLPRGGRVRVGTGGGDSS